MSLLYSPAFKYSDGELRKNHQELMDSNIYHQHHHQQQQQNQNSGLMRLRSAPSSLLASLVDGGGGGGEGVGCEDYRYVRSSSPEVETMLARFMSNGSGDSGSQMVYQAQQAQSLPNHNSVAAVAGTALDSSYSVMNSVGLENSMQPKMGTGRSNLVRQSSSPAGLFSDLNMDNGFAVIGEASPSTTRLSDHLSFSSGPRSCSRHMPQIAEIGNEINSPEDQSLRDGNGSNQHYIPNFSNWDKSGFNDLKRARDNDGNMFPTSNTLETQNSDCGNRIHALTHHLSLPKTMEMATIEKFLQFQGSVPCKIRAKRGFATHPRSIAERVRRTRISERMRKLQELFPNMDKQTNTADMLDLAVEYIKDLQKQVKTLTDTKGKCTCSSKQKQYSNSSV